MAEMTQEELVQEVLDRVLQSSTGVEDLETVTSLSGVKSLPGEKDGKMVNVPLELIGKPASDAAARAEAAAKKAEGAVAGLEEKTQAATEAAAKANEAATKAENAAVKVEQTTTAAVGGATARFSSWMETGNVLPDKGTKPGGSVVYVADAGKFAYYMDSTLYGDWDVAGVPPCRYVHGCGPDSHTAGQALPAWRCRIYRNGRRSETSGLSPCGDERGNLRSTTGQGCEYAVSDL